MECQHCTGVVSDQGAEFICKVCRVFDSTFSREALAGEVEHFTSEASADGGVIVEFSGGRHSAVAMALARTQLNLDVLAVTINNGFIPSTVLEQAQKICSSLGVRHVVVEASLAVDQLVDSTCRPVMAVACRQCNHHINNAVLQIARELGVRWVANGENKYRALQPRVSAVGSVSCRGTDKEYQCMTINLPFAMRVNRPDVDRVLSEIGWQDPGTPGMSSNCLIPWISAESQNPDSPANPLLELIAAEVRCGYLSREEGLSMARGIQGAPIEETEAVLARARRWGRERSVPRIAFDSARG